MPRKRAGQDESTSSNPLTFVIPLKPFERGQEVDERALHQVSEYSDEALSASTGCQLEGARIFSCAGSLADLR